MIDLSVFEYSFFLFTEESKEAYHPGGYHPVSLGDTFNEGRYEVHHKLGNNSDCTVWLVRDLK